VRPTPSLAALGLTAALLGALTTAPAAEAAGTRPAPVASSPRTTHAQPAQNLRTRRARIDITGVVLSHTRHTARVIVSRGRVGAKHVNPQVLTVTLAGRSKGSTRPFRHHMVNGYQLHIAGVGSVAGSTVRLGSEGVEQVTTTTSQAWFGVVQQYDPLTHLATTLLLRDGLGGDGGPDGHGSLGQDVTVDVSSAAVTLDGVPGGTIAPGDLVVVLGEASGLTVVASTVFAYSSVPALVGGEITDITDTIVTVGDREGGSPQTVDLGSGSTAIPVILNGGGGFTIADLSVGDHVLVLGSTDGGGAFVPQVALAFNGDDHGPCGDNRNEHRGRGHEPVPADVSASLTDAAGYLVSGIQDGNVTGTGGQATLPPDGVNPAPATASLVTDVQWNVESSSPVQAEFCIAASSDGTTTYHYAGHVEGAGVDGETHPGGCS
jgi:hypothetical protein